jgi:hypothetical protein
VDSDAREPALAQRIEQLAAQAGSDEPERAETGPVLAAALTGLRAELGGLRADLGSLRAELATVRSGVEASVGRLVAEITAAKADTADVARRQVELTTGIADSARSLADLRGATSSLQVALDSLPGGASSLDSALTRLEETVAARVDTVGADLRRSLTAGLAQTAAGTRAAESAAHDTRTAIDERLAAIEDTVDELAERLEALTRDTVGAATDRIAEVETGIRSLTEGALARQADAQDEWAQSISAALGDLATAVDHNLGSLGESLTEAVHSTRESERGHVERVVGEVRSAVGALEERLVQGRDTVAAEIAAVVGFLEGFQESTESRLEEMRAALAGGLRDARAGLVEELDQTIGDLREANEGSRRIVEAEVASMRGDLADALDEVRQRIAANLDQSAETISATVTSQQRAVDEVVRGFRGDILDRVEEARAETLSALEEMRDGVSTAARGGDEAGTRARELATTVAALDATVGDLRAEWASRTDATVAAAGAEAESVLAAFREQVEAALEDVRTTLAEHADVARSSAELLGGGTSRLVTAGHALLGYLAERDRLLEHERTQTFHEVLDAFTEGLSARDRRATAARLSDAMERRRNARDAERYREQQGDAAVEVPTPPDDLEALLAPLVGIPLPAADTKATTPPKPARASKATKASRASKATKTTAGAKQSRPKPAKAAAKRTVAKSAAKSSGTASKSAAKSSRTTPRKATKAAAKTTAAPSPGAPAKKSARSNTT